MSKKQNKKGKKKGERKMSFIEMPLEDAVEKEVMPEGEYDLRIEDAKLADSGEGINVRLIIDGEPNAKSVFHYISLVKPGDDPDKRNNKLLFAKAFCKAFSIPTESGGFNLEDFYGATGRVFLVQDEYEGALNNKIKLRI